MSKNDKFEFFPATTKNPIGKYKQPRQYHEPEATGGGCYPEIDVKATGERIRGTKNTSRGYMSRGTLGGIHAEKSDNEWFIKSKK